MSEIFGEAKKLLVPRKQLRKTIKSFCQKSSKRQKTGCVYPEPVKNHKKSAIERTMTRRYKKMVGMMRVELTTF